MVHDALWLKANPTDSGMLCIGCLEVRLGRTLTSEDFTDAPINQPYRAAIQNVLHRGSLECERERQREAMQPSEC